MLGGDLYFMQKCVRQEGDKTRGMIKKTKILLPKLVQAAAEALTFLTCSALRRNTGEEAGVVGCPCPLFKGRVGKLGVCRAKRGAPGEHTRAGENFEKTPFL